MDLFARARSVIDQRVTTRRLSHEQDDEAQDQDQDQDRAGPQAKLRALLDEMQASASWGEKEHEGEQRRLLQELQTCVLDAEGRQALEKLPKRMCAYEFKPGDIAWNCKVCQVDETCVMCNDCFISSDHEDHEVFFYYTHSGGCCDCGDTEAWASEGFCTRHKGAQDADPLSFLPPDLLVNSRECIGEVMKLVLNSVKEARFGSVINEDDLEVVRDKLGSEPLERRYSVIVHYNELQTSQEFATALNKAHPAIAYQMLKIVGETSSQKQSTVRAKASREEVLELAASLQKHGIVTSIVSCEYKARVPLINSLLQWLASLANLSDGLCRLICEKMCAVESLEPSEDNMEVDEADDYPMLRAVIMADSFLPKTESDALHSLLMALLADPLFKQAFAISFTSSYRQLYREFAAGVGSSTATILAFSVQFFNRATFVKKLVAEYDLLEVLVNSVLETLRKKRKTDFVDVAFEDTWSSMVHMLHPDRNQELDLWDVFAMGIQRSQGSTLRDVDFSFQLLGVDWVMASIMERFDVEEWYEAAQSSDAKEAELMVTECLALLSQLASELPPKLIDGDAMRSLIPYLRREIVQRLCVGPCAHSDLSKIANEFFLSRENLFPANFSGGPILDQILKEVCVEAGFSVASGTGDSSAAGGGKFQYRLKPELYAEYNPTFVHLTRKQHESAHENWFQHRLRSSKKREQEQVDGSPNNTHSTWLDYPMVNMFLPCPLGFRLSRISILHEDARRLVYESLWRATTDAHSSLSVLSRAVHLFTLQLYVVEDVRYFQTMVPATDAEHFELERASRIADSFIEWIPQEQPSLYADAEPRCAILHLLLKLNPWSSHGGSASMTKLDGDQKHEIGRGIDWLLHRLSRISPECKSVVEQHQVTEQESRDEAARKLALAQRRKEAQMRAMQQMQQRQAAFAEQMKAMTNETEQVAVGEDEDGADGEREKHTHSGSDAARDDSDVEMDGSEGSMIDDAPLVECAMCHSVDSENSFMCYVGFAQCSPVLSRLNGGSHGQFLSTPMDEMHVGEDIPVHVRLCGHSVHHKCWESYHTSQFQRAITGGHHRHALNAVDVTKKEFLCPLCKSISNVLIPTTTDEISKFLPSIERRISIDGSSERPMATVTQLEMVRWLEHAVGREHATAGSDVNDSTDSSEEANALLLEQKPKVGASSDEDPSETQQLNKWLEDGLASLCMAVHKVACGAMQKSQPERYTTSGCNALFHTLLCSFLDTHDTDQLREHLFLEAMRFLPLMLKHVSSRVTSNSSVTPTDLYEKILHLLFYGGSDVLPDGTVVLESEHPSTQTQTRKQSQWGKVRWPQKPLLLSHLGSVLMKGLLLAKSEEDAAFIARLVVLARLVQTLLWYAITSTEDFTHAMANDLAFSEENVAAFVACFSDENASYADTTGHIDTNREDAVGNQLELLLKSIVSKCDGAFQVGPIADKRQLLNVVACEVVPIAKVATFMLQSLTTRATSHHRAGTTAASKPIFITQADVLAVGFVKLDALQFHEAADNSNREQVALTQLVSGWVHRFKAAYEEMNDPHAILQQWLTTANVDRAEKLVLPLVLSRDLHTMHSTISVYSSGANRTRYLRSLPRAYVKFYSELAKRKCHACHQFPARPAVCLLCGMLLCAANTCPSIHLDKGGYPDEANPGACTVHAKKCGRGSGVFLLVLEGAVLLVYWKLAAYVGSLYVDEYGEEFGERNRELSKGRPLYLNEERRERLLRLWLRHEIPNEVVKIQNSSERVIRNSHY
ncbi:hypothetical protein PF010_g721 [Phytophthora fragariae]|uniref:E3 ubiquitin-protein ligase n=1 Tax=Phytophthora fragariae TaxID=53985 RepID=A0A6G0M238_9STRA|nr:hypothetical protein PF003_g21130 [Phytophthora fragariae]KAE9139047.1 hypothetical protein PF010_g721 [Phytophthora fragariae]